MTVRWWDEPFNYSAVNNRAAAEARGDVLVFLNDDTELVDPGWMRELVAWVRQPGIGLAGVQLVDPDDLIQHGGVVVGMNGFADHLFAGPSGRRLDLRLDPLVPQLAVGDRGLRRRRRRGLAAVGGFDERFRLCGSDVVLGLDMRFRGLRSVVTPFAGVRHLESATRGAHVEPEDFPASYWRYQKWLRGGDPYFSPNLSLLSRLPALRPEDEPSPLSAVAGALGRDFTVFRQRADESESLWLASLCRADEGLRGRVEAAHAAEAEPFAVRTVNWFIPDIDSPFYGGINTAFRMADQLARTQGVENRFVVMAAPNDAFLRSALAAAFPRLADAPIHFFDGGTGRRLAGSPADASIATLWVTAYSVAHVPGTRRRFYLIQDFEPMFYPAGTNYALAEESYRLGLYGLCNTPRLLDIYRRDYGGEGHAFVPAVDPTVFHAEGRAPLDHDRPVTIFLYARPGHWRNCWEIASLALDELKAKLGEQVRIVTAGSWARPDELGRGIEHLGLLDYRDTGALYRSCDAGIALTLSEHPSYLPLELMACGAPVVAFDNPAGDWVLHHERNALRCPRTVDGLADAGAHRLRRRPAAAAGHPGAGRHRRPPRRLGGGPVGYLPVPVRSDGGRPMKEYPREFGEEGSHGHCHRLLARSGLRGGLVLDLGCSSGPLAEPVADLGFDYVGADIDQAAGRARSWPAGFEGHVLDLSGDEDAVHGALAALVGDRPLAAVLLLDVIEHLVDPGPLLRALARLDAERGGVHLIASIPNVTHVDVGIKLLLGRWDLTKIGLLDDTHVRFYNERLVNETLAGGGWVEADADDVVNPFSDQLFPADAPALRPGVPIRQLLWRLRMAAAGHGETYQFVRRYVRDPEAAAAVPRAPVYEVIPDDDDKTFLAVIVGPSGGGPDAAAPLFGDLAAQTTDDLEVVGPAARATWRAASGCRSR